MRSCSSKTGSTTVTSTPLAPSGVSLSMPPSMAASGSSPDFPSSPAARIRPLRARGRHLEQAHLGEALQRLQFQAVNEGPVVQLELIEQHEHSPTAKLRAQGRELLLII